MIALLVAALASIAPATAYTAASVARCESSARFDDGAAVLATALTRARVLRRPLLSVLRQPWQFATGCPAWPRSWSWRHAAMGMQATVGGLTAPVWARAAWFYCGRESAERCHNRRGPLVGRVVHSFYGRR
jgi:hypothetical protein